MPELPSGITISKIKNASSATRSGATPEQTTVRFFFAGPAEKMVGRGTIVSFSSCQQNLIKTFQIEALIALITKMILIFS